MRNVYLFFLFLFFISTYAQSTLYINEFLASNSTTNTDGTGQYEDWIEVFNAGTSSIDLQGYYLSDDTNNITRFEITQSVIIPPNGFALFWASGDTSRGGQHTNFKLSASNGEAVILTSPDGFTVIDSIVFGPQNTDVSKGRTTDGASTWSYFSSPTPNATNNNATPFDDILQRPTFSVSGGFYTSPQTLNITSQDTGVTIYYTLDGSRPDTAHINPKTYTYKNQFRQFPSSPTNFPFLTDSIETFIYDQPLNIVNRTPLDNRTSSKTTTFNQNPDYIPDSIVQKGTVVRAIAHRPGSIPSDIETHTYFIGSDLMNRYTFPVLSLNIDEDLLFDYHNGYFTAGVVFENWRSTNNGVARGNTPANWHWSGRLYERPMAMEYFSVSGQREFSMDVGARIHGGWSRARRRKSFRLYARSEYGQSTFDYPFFTNRPHSEYKRILVRNSGNDEIRTSFRDAAIQNLVSHLEFDIQHSEPVIVFLNGEYWGFYNLREWQNRFYIERMYGLQSDEIDFLTPFRIANDGDASHFTATINYAVQQNLSDDSLFAELERRIVIEDFTDYVISEVFARNTDWPVNNIKWWRKRTTYDPDAPRGHDGRWRWLMYDVDFGYGMSGGPNAYTHNTLVHAKNNGDVGILLRNMWPNINYRHYFINRYADLMNTCFLPAHTIGVFDSIKQLYSPEISEFIDRWSAPPYEQAWIDSVDVMKNFADERPAFARLHLMNEFNLTAAHEVTLDVSDTLAGHVSINTITILDTTVGVPESPYPWQGIYFQNVPISLKAHANPGYQFLHWEIGNQIFPQDEIDINLTSDSLVLAVFTSDTNIVCGPSTHNLEHCAFTFTEWDSEASIGSSPDHVQFVYFDEDDPSDTALIAGLTNGAYNLSSRTRIVGLNDDGIGFINTSNPQGNPGYPGTRLGGMIVNLNTENINQAFVQWTGGTLEPNSRVYHIKLQYRLGTSGPWTDLIDSQGNPVVYERQATFNHSNIIGPVDLPTFLMGRECVQLLWRYHYTGQRLSSSSGARDFLRIDDIVVSQGSAPSEAISPGNPTGDIDIQGERVVLRNAIEPYSITPSAGLTYEWSVVNGTIINGQGTSSINVQWNNGGAGSVSLETSDINDCELYESVIINISDLGIDNHKAQVVNVYPNPSTGTVHIDHKTFGDEPLTIHIINGAGQKVYEKDISSQGSTMLDLDLPAAHYQLQILDRHYGIVHNQRITIIPN